MTVVIASLFALLEFLDLLSGDLLRAGIWLTLGLSFVVLRWGQFKARQQPDWQSGYYSASVALLTIGVILILGYFARSFGFWSP